MSARKEAQRFLREKYEYEVEMDSSYKRNVKRGKWLRENLGQPFFNPDYKSIGNERAVWDFVCISNRYWAYFKKEEDAVLFKLTWV